MYTVRIGDKDLAVPDLPTLASLVKSNQLADNAAVYDHSDGTWKTVASLISSPGPKFEPSSSLPTIEWFYSFGGERKGPVGEQEIAALMSSGKLNLDSPVWNNTFSDWKAVRDTTLSKLISGPPPLSGTHVNNGLIWLLAFAPIIGLFLEGFVNGLTNIAIDNLWWITLALNIAISYGDAARLKKGGHDTSKFGGIAWFIPAYMWKRANALKQSKAYFWVWVVLFCVTIFAPIVAEEQKPGDQSTNSGIPVVPGNKVQQDMGGDWAKYLTEEEKNLPETTINRLVSEYASINRNIDVNKLLNMQGKLVKFPATFSSISREDSHIMAYSAGWAEGSTINVFYNDSNLANYFTDNDPRCCDNRFLVIGSLNFYSNTGDLYIRAKKIVPMVNDGSIPMTVPPAPTPTVPPAKQPNIISGGSDWVVLCGNVASVKAGTPLRNKIKTVVGEQASIINTNHYPGMTPNLFVASAGFYPDKQKAELVLNQMTGAGIQCFIKQISFPESE